MNARAASLFVAVAALAAMDARAVPAATTSAAPASTSTGTVGGVAASTTTAAAVAASTSAAPTSTPTGSVGGSATTTSAAPDATSTGAVGGVAASTSATGGVAASTDTTGVAASPRATGAVAADPAAATMGVPPGEKPPELVGAEIVDKLGARVPLDVALVDDLGRTTTLADAMRGAAPIVGDDRALPVLLTLGYYECPMLCSMVLKGALDALKQVSLEPGRDFRIVSVSIDPRDTPKIAAMKRATYLKDYGRDIPDDAWRFFTATADESKRLADAVGFGYRFDEASQQYAHGAGLFFLSPDGVLTRTIWGLTYAPLDVKLALMDAAQGKVGTVVDRILLSCFRYSTTDHKYNVYVWGLLRIAAALTVLVVGGTIFTFWRRDRARAAAA